MDRKTFERLLNELDANSVKTLVEKNARYSSSDDTLHNFKAGGDIIGSTAAMACWGYLTKHLVALRDMVVRNDFSNRDDFLEKCQDSINYIRFLWCIGNEGTLQEFEEQLGKLSKSAIQDGYEYQVCFFESYGEASDLLDHMREIIRGCGFVTVAEMYSFVGLADSYSDTQYGWNNLTGAHPVVVGTAFGVELPPVQPIDALFNNKAKEND